MAEDSPDRAARQCRGCHEIKPLTEFRQALKRGKYEPRSKCKPCESTAAAERFQRNSHAWNSRTAEARQNEHRKAAEKAGRPYRTIQEIAGQIDAHVDAWRRWRDNRAKAASEKRRKKARKEEWLAAWRAAPLKPDEYRCKSQEEFDAIRLSLAPSLRFRSPAKQYEARYELDFTFNLCKRIRNEVT